MIQLHIDCEPKSWSAALKGKNGFYDKKSKHKEFVRWQIKSQYREKPIMGHVCLDLIFFVPIPQKISRAKYRQMVDRLILPTTPDTTNMQKLYEDCLQGTVIDNDRYVSEIHSRRFYSEKPGVTIRIKKLNTMAYEEETSVTAHNKGWIKV